MRVHTSLAPSPGAEARSTTAAAPPRGRGASAAAPAVLAAVLLAACVPVDSGRRASSVEFPAGWPFPADTTAESSRHAMVATGDSLVTAAGSEILRAGGNAVDAAVSVQFALAVVEPKAGNIGGGGFLVLRTGDGTAASLDFREEAPGAATPDMYLDEQGEVTDESVTGYLASGVPGSVAGMVAAHERFGSLPWPRLLQPAIRYAEEGFTVSREFHDAISGHADRLRRFPTSAAKWLPGDEAPPVGSTFRQPGMARALRAIAETKGRAFYEGWIADSLVAAMERGGGLITREDLAAYEARWRDPIVADYRGRTLVSMPPPSSGGVTLAEMLNIVEGFDLDSPGWHSADAIHVAVEAMRRAYGDRNYWLGDPDFVDMPLERLTSQAYADSLAATIQADTVSSSEEFNKVPLAEDEPGSRHTTHFSIVDSAGTAVAVTTTINRWYGSAVTVPGAGFVLNDEMDDFTAKPGVPNIYGLVQGEANAIRPGKRPLSAMTPTILADSLGDTELVTGTPGGSTIITTVFQQVMNHVDHRFPVQASVNAPRFHHQNLPDRLRYEKGGLPDSVVAALRARGHEVVERGGYSGSVASVYVAPDGTLYGAADPRRGGKAMGLEGGSR